MPFLLLDLRSVAGVLRPVSELIDPLLVVVWPVARLCAALLDLVVVVAVVVVVVVVVVVRLLPALVRPLARLAAQLGLCLHYGFLLFVGWLPVLVVLAVVGCVCPFLLVVVF